MPNFSKQSSARLATCDLKLQDICNELIKLTDFVVLCGERNEADQNHAFDTGVSKVRFPDSKHNSSPSQAVDIAPYPIDWNNLDRFKDLARQFCDIAAEKGIDVKWGGHFSKLVDMPHFELA